MLSNQASLPSSPTVAGLKYGGEREGESSNTKDAHTNVKTNTLACPWKLSRPFRSCSFPKIVPVGHTVMSIVWGGPRLWLQPQMVGGGAHPPHVPWRGKSHWIALQLSLTDSGILLENLEIIKSEWPLCSETLAGVWRGFLVNDAKQNFWTNFWVFDHYLLNFSVIAKKRGLHDGQI